MRIAMATAPDPTAPPLLYHMDVGALLAAQAVKCRIVDDAQLIVVL